MGRLKETITGDSVETSFDIEETTRAILDFIGYDGVADWERASPDDLFPWRVCHNLAYTISDLLVSARQRRALVIHFMEVQNLRIIYFALNKYARDPRTASLAETIRSLAPIDTPSLILPLRTMESLDEIMRDLMTSEEFREYGQEREALRAQILAER